MNTVISIIIILGALIFFHELGHLWFAKRAGILCREFAIGFGPKVFSFKKNETTYTIRLLPLGGFVRMAGEDPETVDVKPGQRIGLIFNEAGKVSKIIINNKEKHPNAKIITVEKAELEHKLIIEGQSLDEEVVEYKVDERCDFIIDEQPYQIAPYNRQFGSKTLWQRTLAIAAGPLMNFALALVILAVFGYLQGPPIDEPILGELTEDGAAVQAGLKEGDRVLQIEENKIESWEDLVNIVSENPEKELTFSILRPSTEEEMEINVTPGTREMEDGNTRGYIGVYMPTEQLSIFGAIYYGFDQTVFITKLIFKALGGLVTGDIGFDQLSGPVGIYKFTDVAAQQGIYVLMKWAAMLSINLAIFNLLPLPALDGGRLLFLGVEAVRGKPIDPQKEGIIHFIGFALLMLLMLVVTWNDIQKFFL
ncbi:RIP metalloprotease RseP [Lottiidibacillus patelloidae]|uniref:Zinc metalloprotease n=1 Tax=Lottiidibacillus patelloidae TaxID=2670334 RepID=A0A263BZA5_9BACI|nr:RIP metalloprotease RseP [Lottiidibacillus patelloidae]OZM58607.1 RIP metalloprotease RseP [Lottiidibacillus patelloidae]